MRRGKHRNLLSSPLLQRLSLGHVDELVHWGCHLGWIRLLRLSEVLMGGGRLVLSLSIASFIVVRTVSSILVLIHDRVARYDRHGGIDAACRYAADCRWHAHAVITCFWHSVTRRSCLHLRILGTEPQGSFVGYGCGSF